MKAIILCSTLILTTVVLVRPFAPAPIVSAYHNNALIAKAASNSDIDSFASLGLSEDMLTVAQKMEWSVPTAVQQLSIPAILDMGNSNSIWSEGPTG